MMESRARQTEFVCSELRKDLERFEICNTLRPK